MVSSWPFDKPVERVSRPSRDKAALQMTGKRIVEQSNKLILRALKALLTGANNVNFRIRLERIGVKLSL
jgi:hypothetical protein